MLFNGKKIAFAFIEGGDIKIGENFTVSIPLIF